MGVGLVEALRVILCLTQNPSPPSFPPGVRNASHPFGGEKVHWTFSVFRLTPLKGRVNESDLPKLSETKKGEPAGSPFLLSVDNIDFVSALSQANSA